MRHSALLVLVVLAVACHTEPAPDLTELQGRATFLGDQLDHFAARLHAHKREIEDAVAAFARASDEFARAHARYEDIVRQRRAERSILEKASADYERAREHWQIAQALIVTAAAFDASRLEASSAQSEWLASCEGGMSTRAFRRLLLSMGVSLLGMHIDHILPRSLGGADHPLNYRVIPAYENQSLGNTWNAAKCAQVGSGVCKRAVSISRVCGGFRGGMPRF